MPAKPVFNWIAELPMAPALGSTKRYFHWCFIHDFLAFLMFSVPEELNRAPNYWKGEPSNPLPSKYWCQALHPSGSSTLGVQSLSFHTVGGKKSGKFPWEITAALITHSQLRKQEINRVLLGWLVGAKPCSEEKPWAAGKQMLNSPAGRCVRHSAARSQIQCSSPWN